MRYTFTISFEADRALTSDEIEQIANALHLQVEEPTDQENEYMDIITKEIEVSLK
jgi:hypothetical protein